jgi:uncharacterized repeat protein (TIGR01451 family)
MKALNKFAMTGATLATLSIASLAAAPMVAADGTGQIEGGSGVYEIKNLTQNGAYADSITAKCGDEVEYSIRLHNSGYVAVNDINVTATLPNTASSSNTSNVDITYTDGVVPSTTASASVTLDSASDTVNYEDGTAVLYDGNGNKIETLGDTVNTSGLSLGSLNGSTTEYLNFKAEVKCPAPVTTTTPSTPTIVTTTSTPSTPATAAPQLVNTGAGDVIGIFAAATAAGVAAFHFVVRRSLNRQ